MSDQQAARPSRRAPRLAADRYLAPHITRSGRFRARDPLRPRALPAVARVLGAVGWALLVGVSLGQAARRRERTERP